MPRLGGQHFVLARHVCAKRPPPVIPAIAAGVSNLHFRKIPTSEIPPGLKREAKPGGLETNRADDPVLVLARFREICGLLRSPLTPTS